MGSEQDERESEDFEEIVEALLRVDPKGLSGKHRKPPAREDLPETNGKRPA